MPARYVESSAVVAWLLGEDGSERVVREIDEADVVTTSALTILECERTLVRRLESEQIAEAEAARARGVLSRERARWIVLAIDGEILERAGRAFPVEPVRALDAIHLATALQLLRAFPDLEMLTLDRRISANAVVLGLSS